MTTTRNPHYAQEPDPEEDPFGPTADEGKIIFPEIITGETIRSEHVPLPPEIISGMLSRGEKGELAGGSKSFKTWA
jgi:hypothetical protein